MRIIGQKYQSYLSHALNHPRPTCSIIVPVYNEHPELFQKCVASLAHSGPSEIVVITDSNATNIQRIANATVGAHKTVCMVEDCSKREALVKGFFASTGDIVVFVDSDCAWDAETLKELLIPFERNDVGGVQAREVVSIAKGTLAEQAFALNRLMSADLLSPFLAVSERAEFLTGRTSAYRRKALEPIIRDLIRKDVKGAPGDDIVLAQKIQSNGWKALSQRSAHVYVQPEQSLWTLFQQMLRWSRSGMRNRLWRQIMPIGGRSGSWKFRMIAAYEALQMSILLEPISILAFLISGHPMIAVAILILVSAVHAIQLAVMRKGVVSPTHIVLHILINSYVLNCVALFGVLTFWKTSWITRSNPKILHYAA